MTTLLFLLACSGGKDSSTESTDSSSTNNDSGTETTATGTGTGKVAPVIKSVDSGDCTTFTGSDPPDDAWNFLLTVDDPQGADTVRTGSCDAKKGAGVIGTIQIVCRNGTCTGSSRSSIDGFGCDFGGTFSFTVQDTDGNTSAPFTYDPNK